MAHRYDAAPFRGAALKSTVATLTVAVAVALLGCTSYADPVDGSTPLPSALPGRVVNAPGSALTADDLFCTQKRPIDGVTCTFPGSACEYGGSPDLTCETIVDCLDNGDGTGAWSSRPPNPQCIHHDCPSAFGGVVQGSACEIDVNGAPAPASAEYLCAYDEGTCGCTTGADAAHAHARSWVCTSLSPWTCPRQRPVLGMSCAGTIVCDYGSCLFKHGTAVKCDGEHWVTTEIDCN